MNLSCERLRLASILCLLSLPSHAAQQDWYGTWTYGPDSTGTSCTFVIGASGMTEKCTNTSSGTVSSGPGTLTSTGFTYSFNSSGDPSFQVICTVTVVGSVVGNSVSGTQTQSCRLPDGTTTGQNAFTTNLIRGSSSAVVDGSAATSDCLFNWAESQLPSYFSASTEPLSQTMGSYRVRYYPGTQAYLGTSSSDQHLYYRGPLTANNLTDLGLISKWQKMAGCQSGNVTPLANPTTREWVTVKGLNTHGEGATLTLGNDIGDLLPVTSSGTFPFPTPLGSAARVETVRKQPAGQVCQPAVHISLTNPYTRELMDITTTDFSCFETPCGGLNTLGNAPAPTGLSITTNTDPTTLTVSWTPDPWATSYRLYYGTDPLVVTSDPITNFVKAQNYDSTIPATTKINFLTPGTQYYFAVTSIYSSPGNFETCQSSASAVATAAVLPVASAVTPQSATIGQPTTFTVTGANLTAGMGFSITGCTNLTDLGGTPTSWQFQCTPTTTGSVSGLVSSTSNGNALLNFSVTVNSPTAGTDASSCLAPVLGTWKNVPYVGDPSTITLIINGNSIEYDDTTLQTDKYYGKNAFFIKKIGIDACKKTSSGDISIDFHELSESVTGAVNAAGNYLHTAANYSGGSIYWGPSTVGIHFIKINGVQAIYADTGLLPSYSYVKQ